MAKIQSLDSFKIPAFQRKRSLSAKARRSSKPATAFERRIAGVPVIKPKRTCVPRRRAVRDVDNGYSGVGRDGFSSPLLDECSGGYGDRVSGFSSRAVEPPDSRSFGYGSVESVCGSESGGDSGGGFREMRLCGRVEDFFDKISVVAVKVSSSIRVGDRLVFETQYGLFEQAIDSMQINREDVVVAYNGDDLGIKVLSEPKKGGNVYKVV